MCMPSSKFSPKRQTDFRVPPMVPSSLTSHDAIDPDARSLRITEATPRADRVIYLDYTPNPQRFAWRARRGASPKRLIGCSTGEQVEARNGETGAFRSAQARSGRAAKKPISWLRINSAQSILITAQGFFSSAPAAYEHQA